MKNTKEIRGRKTKSVDADLFRQLVKYYRAKKETEVMKSENQLFHFFKCYAENSTDFDKLKLTHNEVIALNPNLDEMQIWTLVREKDPGKAYYEFKTEGVTDDVFAGLRERENKRIRRNSDLALYSAFNIDDIKKADKLFKNLLQDNAKKLLQRLRKAKFKESHQYNNRKIGLDLDQDAFEEIKTFTNKYGFKSHSLALVVMSKMACQNYNEGAFEDAVNSASSMLEITADKLFRKNKDVDLALSRVTDNLIYYSKKRYRFYLNVSLSANDETLHACEFKNDNILRQIRRSERINISDISHSFYVTGVIKTDGEMEQFNSADWYLEKLYGVSKS